MRLIPALLAVLALDACTGTRAVAPADASGTTELRLKAGDEIRVVTKNRERMSLEITEIRTTELAGITLKPKEHETVPEGRNVVVPYADLAMVEVRRFSAARTAAMPAVVLLVATGLVLAAMPAPMMGP